MHVDVGILIVDDDGLIRALLRQMLIKCGFTDLHEAADGFQALSMLAENRFGLVILDLNMPGMDGLEVCRRIAKDFPAVSVILMSGSMVDGKAFTRAGAAGCLDKPVTVPELDGVVHRVLAERGDHHPATT